MIPSGVIVYCTQIIDAVIIITDDLWIITTLKELHMLTWS